MQKKVSHSFSRVPLRPARFGLLVAASIFLAVATLIPTWRHMVWADEYQAQINALTEQNAANRSALSELESVAQSYADAIQKLQQQIDGLQASINTNLDLQAQLQKQIIEAQAEIDRQRAILAEDVKAMYVDGTPSSLEMLASSRDFSDYVDKQEYRSRVQAKLQDTLKKIAELQKQLQVQKAKVEQLIRDLQVQQSQLNADRAKQWELLNMNEAKQAEYDAQIKANNSKAAELRAAQAAANRRLSGGSPGGVVAGDPSHGGYPASSRSPWGGYWGTNYSLDNTIDNWGMYNRECVSYTAWKVYSTYGYMPYWGGVGNANQWPGNAARAGIPTSSTPRVGSVAVWNVGYYGHVMWVEAVNNDGSIWISQFNYDFRGNYSEMLISAGMASNLTYIYFDEM
ncbi:CHAP domain-containing protein [Candidatus Saccharibacteria bacterium]|nr:MAG: CHAP domain-containing protein [Candidatus Saccharibacteria bacterium]